MRRVIWLALLCLAPFASFAQTAGVTMIADRMSIKSDDVLVAEGNVEVFYDGSHLRATRITYDPDTDRLKIEGPLTLASGENIVLMASSADLDPALTSGILQSARLLLDQQMQIAAAQIHRVDDRYLVLDKTVASSCRICVKDEVPLWQIRASRVVHDEEEQQIYFENARFEIAGVPVLYLPSLRLPDPTLKRSTGFLSPSIRITDALGTGIKFPYFITLGDHADLTVTPYLSTGQTRTLELRYRHAFRNGRMEWNGAISKDDIEDDPRSYIFGNGRFELPRDFVLEFQLQDTSDPSYLLDYDYSDADRLESNVKLTRVTRDEIIRTEAIHYNPLRSDIDKEFVPTKVLDLGYELKIRPSQSAGVFGVEAGLLAFERDSSDDADGRDIQRLHLGADWTNSWTFDNGLLLTADARLKFDAYNVDDDGSFDNQLTRLTPSLAVEMRYPLVKSGYNGASYVLEPVLQLAWADPSGDDVPNDDSLSPVLDEGNLFALDRFAGEDVVERGLRANLGVGWTRYSANGWSFGIDVGRVFYERDLDQFDQGSGLDGYTSDWLVSTKIFSSKNLTISNRSLLDDTLGLSSSQLRVDWQQAKFEFETAYVWLAKNALEGRTEDSSEWDFDGTYRFDRNWSGRAEWRYDFTQDRAQEAGLGLIYKNECVIVDLSVSRRFTSSDTVRPTTDFGIDVTFGGFGNNATGQSYRRSCTGV
ncbi:LPS-assembly protein LptD [Actibacterium pelagium]|uniref:LPS-assembly protein LptD n=1 Tax=Actibacterium pelagium TaxID=2029103 RepID=A0A917EHZ8_9RHOB|nr:LPS assembly protein LptD [Actibacterium pelagium]GGE44742.1 LPS-assembly protein LptD [Actibacterium pelagium]